MVFQPRNEEERKTVTRIIDLKLLIVEHFPYKHCSAFKQQVINCFLKDPMHGVDNWIVEASKSYRMGKDQHKFKVVQIQEICELNNFVSFQETDWLRFGYDPDLGLYRLYALDIERSKTRQGFELFWLDIGPDNIDLNWDNWWGQQKTQRKKRKMQ
jgi:hypothetical protein